MEFSFRWAIKFLAIISCFVTVGLVQAEVALDNLAPGGGASSSDKNFANISRWGQGFTSTASGYISNVKLNLYRTNTQSGAFAVELWSDGGVNPGIKVATLKTLDWFTDVPVNNTAFNTSQYVEVTSFEENYNLSVGENYWIVVSQASNGPFAKRWTVNGTGIGQTASYNANTGLWASAGSTTNLGVQISVAVPEPGTFILSAFALLLGFGALSFGKCWLIPKKLAFNS